MTRVRGKQTKTDLLRLLPQVEELLSSPLLDGVRDGIPRPMLADAVRLSIDSVRKSVLDGTLNQVSTNHIVADVKLRVISLKNPSLRRVINATGVVIHTNLGRSVLAKEAAAAVHDVASGYSTLEYDTSALARGSRHLHCEQLLCSLTGAEAALAVNNNAAAVMMVLFEFARGHEAIVSRGELIEIGDSFRMPDIMKLSDASMVEVGTTNKTHLQDYASALTPNTSLLVKVHPSNFRLTGFTESVSIADLKKFAQTQNACRKALSSDFSSDPLDLLVYEDQGSGSLLQLPCFGGYAEPSVAESLRAGADIVSFSGDKLLGGPQAGIIVGSKTVISRLKKNPLARALRLDKMSLAALEATLRLYLNPDVAYEKIPTLAMLSASSESLKKKADTLCQSIMRGIPQSAAELSVVPEVSRAGGGALPMCDIETYCVKLKPLRVDSLSCERFLVSQRAVPIVCRIKHEAILFDVRTLIGTDDIEEITQALSDFFTEQGSDKQ